MSAYERNFMFDENKKKSMFGLIIAILATALVLAGIIGGIILWRIEDKQPATKSDVSMYTEL